MEGDVTVADGSSAGTLYVVSTPIGNMGDFSFRAVETLKSVALILAEDTRHTRHLLDRYDIPTSTVSYHEHNEAKMTPVFVARLVAGESLALVSDAGTPLISDPGARLIAAAAEAQVAVVPIPGASALLAALVASGLDAERFTFFGFLARSGSERRRTLDELATLSRTAVLYEAPNRVVDTLSAIEQRGGGARAAAVAREMTKQFEEVRRGTVSDLRAYYEDRPARGEIVLIIGAAIIVAPSDELVRDRVRALRTAGMSARDTAALVAEELGVPKRLAYRYAQDPDGEGGDGGSSE
jgi:16S rRNA (cytidine1402-2'-O)-methyltransferase